MMFVNKLFLSTLFVSHAAAIGGVSKQAGQVEENTGPLRGRMSSDGKQSIIAQAVTIPERENVAHVEVLSVGTKNLVNNGSQTVYDDNSGIKHMIIACKDGEEELVCKKRILDAISTDSRQKFRLNTYLTMINAYAAEFNGSISILTALDAGDIHVDPPRETMHIKESIQIQRNLQGGQAIPYGIVMIKAMNVWDEYNNKGENVRICVIDTGVNRDHPDLDEDRMFGYDGNELVQPWYRDVDGHGTHVSGIIAASDNNEGVVGVAPGAEIFTARVFSTNGQFYSSNVITALQVCKDAGAKVISMSLGGPDSLSYEKQAYTDLHEKYGIVTVSASGNDGGTNYSYPASYDNVISVSSVNWDYERSSFSTRNNKVDVAAPGSRILSTYENRGYALVSGTSMSCPHVSGVVALMLNANPSATPAQIFKALETSSENPNTTERDNDMGYGIVNALAAVKEISKINNSIDIGSGSGNNNGNNNGSSGNTGGTGNNNNGGSASNNNAGSSDSDCVQLVITLKTDKFGSDTSHWLKEGSQFLFYFNSFDSYSTYQETACIDPKLCSEYNIRDAFGDGISGEGLEVKYGGEVVYEGGDWGIGGVKYLGAC